MIRVKGMYMLVLAAVVLPQYNFGQHRRVITTPCAQELGPRFRCINPVNCGPKLMQNLTEIVTCGPNGIGMCCPVISFLSPARCGIRTPSITNLFQNQQYPNGQNDPRIAFTSFTQSKFGQRMITQRDALSNPFAIMNYGLSYANNGMYDNLRSIVYRKKKEPLASSTSTPEVHHEAPLVHVPSENKRTDKSTPVQHRSPKKRSLDDQEKIGIDWSHPQDVSNWENETSDSSDPFQKAMEDYVKMAQKIENLIFQLGGMEVICKEYPELAQILTLESNKTCSSGQFSNNTTTVDWTTTVQKRKYLSFKNQEAMIEVKDHPSLKRKRRNAEEEVKDWKELYYLSREYLRKLLYMMVSENPGKPLSYDSISKLPLYPPFSAKQLQEIILSDPTIVDKNAASQIIKESGLVIPKDPIKNKTFNLSHSSYSDLRSSDAKKDPRTEKDSVSQTAIQPDRSSKQRGGGDEKFSDGSGAWDVQPDMAGRNNEAPEYPNPFEYPNGEFPAFQNGEQPWELDMAQTNNQRGAPEYPNNGFQPAYNGGQFWRAGNFKNGDSTVHNHKSDEETFPQNIFHSKIDHKIDYSKMLNKEDTIKFEKYIAKRLEDTLESSSEHLEANLKGGSKAHSMSANEKSVAIKIENKNEKFRVDGKLLKGLTQPPEIAKDTAEAWVDYKEGNENGNRDSLISAMKTEESRNLGDKISLHQGIADTHSRDVKADPETKVHAIETDAHAIETDDHAIEADDYAIETDDHAIETDDHAIEADDHAIETDDHAIETDDHAIETDDHAIETDGYIIETDDHAIETDVHAIETDDHAIETDDYVIETDDHAIETDVHAIETDAFAINQAGKTGEANISDPLDETNFKTSIEKKSDEDHGLNLKGRLSKAENSRNGQGKISLHQGIPETYPSDVKVAPERDVHFTDQAGKTGDANIPESLDEIDFRRSMRNKNDSDHVFNSNSRFSKRKDEEKKDTLEFMNLPTEELKIVRKKPPRPTIYSKESIELLFNLRNSSSHNKEHVSDEMKSDILNNNTAKHHKTERKRKHERVRKTSARPTHSQKINKKTKMHLSDDTKVHTVRKPKVEKDSSRSRDLEDNSREETLNRRVRTEEFKSTEASLEAENWELESLELEFNHKNRESFIEGKLNLDMEHISHVDGESKAIDESSVILNVEPQHDLKASEESSLPFRDQKESQDIQIDASQKRVLKFDDRSEFGNNHTGMEVKLHTDDQKESDAKLKNPRPYFHKNQKTVDDRQDGSSSEYQGKRPDALSALDTDLLKGTSGVLAAESSIPEKSDGSVRAEPLSGKLDFDSDVKVASEIRDQLTEQLKGEMEYHSNLSTHFNGSSDTSVHLKGAVEETGKNVTLNAEEMMKEQESDKSDIPSGASDYSYKIGVETDDILANVKDSFDAGLDLKISDEEEWSNIELSDTTLSPDAFNDSRGLAISGGLKQGMKLKTGRGRFGLALRTKRELLEPELSGPYDIFLHDPGSIPPPNDIRVKENYQLTASKSHGSNISSNSNSTDSFHSNSTSQTGKKSKTVKKDSISRDKVNLKPKKLNSTVHLKKGSELSKATKTKHSKNTINTSIRTTSTSVPTTSTSIPTTSTLIPTSTSVHTNKKGNSHNSHKKKETKSVKIKNNADSHKNKTQKKSGKELNKHQTPSKNTTKKPSKQKKHISNHEKTTKKAHRHRRDLPSLLMTPQSEVNQQESSQQNKPRKTLNLRILYGKEETSYKPPEVNPFSDYHMPAEESEFEKIVRQGYKNHLFNKDRFSVLHLTKNFKVYKPGEEESSEDEDDGEDESIIGYRNDTSQNKPQFVIGGRNVEAPWPWVVGIYELFTMKFVCAGTLFDSKHVLSAAHCFERYRASNTRFAILIGSEFRFDKRPGLQPGLFRPVKQLFVHEGFKLECYCNDIAILRLETPLDSLHMPACIPHYDPAGVGENATVLGWGDTSFSPERRNTGAGTEILQRVDDLTIFPKEECRNIMSRIAGTPLPENFGDYYICAGVKDGSKDACIGDSGGPLLHEDYDGVWSLIGVVSFGYKCAEPGVPGTYSRIAYYIPWITKTLEKP